MMATKKEVWKKDKNNEMKFIGYLPTEDVVGYSEYSEKIADIITQLGGKANAFGVVGDGISFNNNTITIDTDVMATREWVKAQGYSSESITDQRINDLQHGVTTNSANIATNKASIDSLTNDVANRYTKGETVDNSYAVYMPRINVGADPSAFPAQNKVNFNEIGNGGWIGGLGYQWWHIMTMQGEDTDYFTQIGVMMAFGDTPQLAFRNKIGEDSWAVAISDKTIGSQHVAEADSASCANIMKSTSGKYQVAGDGSNRPTSWDEINAACYNGIRAQLVTSRLGDKVEPDGTIMTFGLDQGYWDAQLLIPGGDTSGKTFNPMIRTQSGTKDYGSWHYIPYMEDVLSSSGGAIDAKGERCPLELKGGISGSRQNIRLYPSNSGGYWTAIAFLDSSANDYGLTPNSWFVGAYEGYFGISKNGDGLYEEGSSYLRNNGDTWEFKGNSVIAHCDLQSTSLTTSPMHVATSEFTVSPDNQPNAERTKQGNLEVTFGSIKKTIHMKYNPFMKYFFEHGYHFSAVKEGGDSTLYDMGIVTYGNFIYYCVYTYRSEDDDDFAAAIIATDDTEDMSKYVMSQGGSASELQIIGNYFRTNGLKKVEIQEKEGTLALIGDFYDKLDSKATDKALSANQGRVLDEKISTLSSSVDSKIDKIKFSGLATNASIGDIGASNDRGDEDLSYSARIYGGTYGRFYVFSGLENGYNRDYGKLVVKTSSTGKADMTTNMVAGVSGETGYWNPQWLSVSVFVPAGQYYYLWGCRITKVYYSCIELVH